jgi:transcriptional regulator with XRE-family HTH domain
MAARKHPQPLRTGGHAWGQQRVRLNVSMNRLAELSGVSKSLLSLAEQGRYLPTGDEWEAVARALRDIEMVPVTSTREAP